MWIRTPLVAARGTRRASALVVLCHTHDVAECPQEYRFLLCSEVKGAWNVAEEQAAEVDRTKARATEPQKLAVGSLRRARHKQQGFTGIARAPIRP